MSGPASTKLRRRPLGDAMRAVEERVRLTNEFPLDCLQIAPSSIAGEPDPPDVTSLPADCLVLAQLCQRGVRDYVAAVRVFRVPEPPRKQNLPSASQDLGKVLPKRVVDVRP